MAKNTSGFKRHFPQIGECCCCCEPKTSVMTCTILILVYIVISFFFSGLGNITNGNLFTYSAVAGVLRIVSSIMNACIVITLILLLFGIDRKKTSLMKPFKIIFLIFFIFEVAYFIYGVKLLYNDDYIQWYIDQTDTDIELEGENKKQFDDIRNNIIGTIVVGELIFLGLMIFYYLTTCNYIEDIEEQEYDESDARQLEND